MFSSFKLSNTNRGLIEKKIQKKKRGKKQTWKPRPSQHDSLSIQEKEGILDDLEMVIYSLEQNDNINDLMAAHEKMPALPGHLVGSLLEYQLLWMEYWLQFRLQPKLAPEVRPNYHMYITTMTPEVWNAFKIHMTNHTDAQIVPSTCSVPNHGDEYVQFDSETFGYSISQKHVLTLPPLKNPNWYFKRYIDRRNDMIVSGQYTSIFFTWNPFNQRVRVDFTYFLLQSRLSGTFKGKWEPCY